MAEMSKPQDERRPSPEALLELADRERRGKLKVFLGMAPGGMPEMALTAKALELAVPLVLGFHLTRTVLCNLLVGPLHRAGLKLGLL